MNNLKQLGQYIRKHKARIKARFYRNALNALNDNKFDDAHQQYQIMYDRGWRDAQVLYGLARSGIGDFGFAASPTKKQETEKLYKRAIKLNNSYAKPYLGLGILYEDWERYGDAAKAYQTYLKKNPKAKDRRKIERRIRVCKRKTH